MSDLDAIHAAAGSPLSVVQALGLEVARGARADRVRVRCPAHDDRKPSCDVALSGSRIVFVCRACGASGGLFGLVAIVRGLHPKADFPRIVEEAAQLFGVRVDGSRAATPRRPAALDLPWRTDLASDAWLHGRSVAPDAAIESATPEQIHSALCDLADADALANDEQDARDDALDAMADDVLKQIAEREASWLTL